MDLRALAEKLTLDDVVELLARTQALTEKVEEQERQLNWFRRQVWGARSERRILDVLPRPDQLWLQAQMLDTPQEPPAKGTTVRTYERSQRRNPVQFTETDSRLRFDEGQVPVEVINLPNPALADLPADQIESISERVTYRLAQRSSYVILKYVQPTVKRRDNRKIVNTPAPPAVFAGSPADVSFLAGMIVDKFVNHLPLYRQHQRLEQTGIALNRGTLSRLVHRTGELLEPIYLALLSSVLQSHVLIVDESPTPAGVSPGRPGKMKTAYFWALLGDQKEVAFLFSPTRARKVLDAALESFFGTLLTDGYAAYDSYVRETRRGILKHALCWVHTRRNFIDAEPGSKEKTAIVLELIQRLYRIEEEVAGPDLELRRQARNEFSRPIVDELFKFFQDELDNSLLLPMNPFLKAIDYAVSREEGLRVFLDDPEVPMDTNSVERELRGPAVGRKNWMFHVTDVGARYAAIFYSLTKSCVLANVNPTVYLIDILQRIDHHPADDVHLLVPRLWKERFGHKPLLSDISKFI